jgi:hypothetical protein
MTAFIVILIIVVIATCIWKFTGHNFSFIKKIFTPLPPRTKGIPSLKDFERQGGGMLSPLAVSGGVKESIKLKSGGTLIVSLDVNILTASKGDRDFINFLIQKIQEYKDTDGGGTPET